ARTARAAQLRRRGLADRRLRRGRDARRAGLRLPRLRRRRPDRADGAAAGRRAGHAREPVARARRPCPLRPRARRRRASAGGSGSRAGLNPIAGTVWPGGGEEAELLTSQKDRAEHTMLVDLGRNDLSRVCLPGSVRVERFMEPERYSHVTHLVSEVVGELRDGVTPFDLLRACFPAGTVSGAPKVRAMQIISELEGYRRGIYA